ncbi:MAG: hypothetical protein ACP5LA_03970 [Thermoplasmata archaeon]|nr:hypothetical protein [Thermoplasmata archaeon]
MIIYTKSNISITDIKKAAKVTQNGKILVSAATYASKMNIIESTKIIGNNIPIFDIAISFL